MESELTDTSGAVSKADRGSSPSRRVYAADIEDGVVVKVVADEPEAEIACGLLRSAGIECSYRDTEAIDSPLEDFIAAGPREILVRAADLEDARALLGDDD